MSKYIDAERLKQILKPREWGTSDERWVPEHEIGAMLDYFPAADVVEVRHGRWKIIKYPTGVEAFGYKEMAVQSLMCSNCSYEIDVSEGYFEYCPNCGSFMDLEYEEE